MEIENDILARVNMEPVLVGDGIKVASLSGQNDAIKVTLESDAVVIVDNPEAILGVWGSGKVREDYYDFIAVLRKTKLKKAKVVGPTQFLLHTTSPRQFFLVNDLSDGLVFNPRAVYLHTCDLKAHYSVPPLDNVVVTQNILKLSFSGVGSIILSVFGTPAEICLGPDERMVVHPDALVCYSAKMKFRMRTYGNVLAARSMPFHYHFIGPGRVLLQGRSESDTVRKGMFHRAMKRYNPFWDVFVE